MKTLKELIAKREEGIKKVDQVFEAELSEFFSEFNDKMVEVILSNGTKETTRFKGYSYYKQTGIIVIHGEDEQGEFQPVPIMQTTMLGLRIGVIKAI